MIKPGGRTDRKEALIDLALIIGAAIIMIDLLSIGPAAVVGGGVGIKLLFLSRMLVLLSLATWRLGRVGKAWRDVGLRRPLLLRGAVATIGGLVVIAVSVAVVGALIARWGFPRANYSAFAPLHGNLPEYLFWLGPVAIGSAAFGEEMIFRGFILEAIERLLVGTRWSTLTAIVVQAVIFGLLHAYQGIGGGVTAGVIGLVLGVVWWGAKRNLWPGIVIHALLDGSAMTAIYFGMPVA